MDDIPEAEGNEQACWTALGQAFSYTHKERGPNRSTYTNELDVTGAQVALGQIVGWCGRDIFRGRGIRFKGWALFEYAAIRLLSACHKPLGFRGIAWINAGRRHVRGIRVWKAEIGRRS